MNKPEILYNKGSTLSFNTSIGTRVSLIKSEQSNIVSFIKGKQYTNTLTMDESDVKILVDWLIEKGMYKVPHFKIME